MLKSDKGHNALIKMIIAIQCLQVNKQKKEEFDT